LGDNINAINKNSEALTDANKGVSPEVNKQKIKYMLISCHLNAGQNHNIKIANQSLKNVAKVKYLGMKAIYLIHEEMRQCSLPSSLEPFVFLPAAKT
jgi:UDP-N-acetylglucosamine 2-epimerase